MRNRSTSTQAKWFNNFMALVMVQLQQNFPFWWFIRPCEANFELMQQIAFYALATVSALVIAMGNFWLMYANFDRESVLKIPLNSATYSVLPIRLDKKKKHPISLESEPIKLSLMIAFRKPVFPSPLTSHKSRLYWMIFNLSISILFSLWCEIRKQQQKKKKSIRVSCLWFFLKFKWRLCGAQEEARLM